MKKSFKDLIKMKATKRIVSAAVAIAMVCEALPVAQIGEKILQTDFSSLRSQPRILPDSLPEM